MREAIPTARDQAGAEFSTLRLQMIKIAARVIETTRRVRLAFAAACFPRLPAGITQHPAFARVTALL